MTADVRQYHRSFLHWPRRAAPPTREDLERMSRRVAQEGGGKPGSAPSTGPVGGSRPGGGADTRKFHAALEVSGSDFRQIKIEEKTDQKFAQYATDWEKKWSRLVDIGNSLSPVVDGDATVVGYTGMVRGDEILIGRATGLALIYTAEETLRYHRLFIGSPKLHAEKNLSVYQSRWVFYNVLTDVDGEVTRFEFSHRSNNGTVESTGFPLWDWLKLIQGGLKLLISIRNGMRTLGRPRPLPQPLPPRQLPPGPPPAPPAPSVPAAPPVGNVSRPGGTTGVTNSGALPGARPRPPGGEDLRQAINNVRMALRLPPIPARTVQQLHAAARGVRADNDFYEWLLANPNASWKEKFDMMEKINARWRVITLPGDE